VSIHNITIETKLVKEYSALSTGPLPGIYGVVVVTCNDIRKHSRSGRQAPNPEQGGNIQPKKLHNTKP
jgi:hypothetical protein